MQRAFIASDRHLFAPDPEQRDRDIVENRLFLLLKEAGLLSIDLPLHLIAFGLSKSELLNIGIRLINRPRRGGGGGGGRGGIWHEEIAKEAGKNKAEP